MSTYTLKQFVDDLDAITAKESDPAASCRGEYRVHPTAVVHAR